MNELHNDSTIRTADLADAATVASVRSLADGIAVDDGFVERIRNWLAAEGARRTTWLAWRDGAAVGMASLLEYRRMPHADRPDTRWGYLSNLYVSPDARRAGIGTGLVDEVIAVSRQRGYVRLVLSTSDEARALFRRAGFVEPAQTDGAIPLLVRPETSS